MRTDPTHSGKASQNDTCRPQTDTMLVDPHTSHRRTGMASQEGTRLQDTPRPWQHTSDRCTAQASPSDMHPMHDTALMHPIPLISTHMLRHVWTPHRTAHLQCQHNTALVCTKNWLRRRTHRLRLAILVCSDSRDCCTKKSARPIRAPEWRLQGTSVLRFAVGLARHATPVGTLE